MLSTCSTQLRLEVQVKFATPVAGKGIAGYIQLVCGISPQGAYEGSLRDTMRKSNQQTENLTEIRYTNKVNFYIYI